MNTQAIIEALKTRFSPPAEDTKHKLNVNANRKEIEISVQGYLEPSELKVLSEITQEFDLYTSFTSEYDSEFTIHLFDRYDKPEEDGVQV